MPGLFLNPIFAVSAYRMNAAVVWLEKHPHLETSEPELVTEPPDRARSLRRRDGEELLD